MALSPKQLCSGTASAGIMDRLSQFNGMLIFIMLYMSCCALNFGYDVGTFGGVQAMQSFARDFGDFDDKARTYALPAWLSSVMTATPFLGKALGCIGCGWLAETWGRRAAILCLCIASFVGVILQVSSDHAAQFTVGRIVTYAMTGMAIVVVPIYQAETSPRALRGMFGSAIQIMIVLGQLVATLVAYATKSMRGSEAWRIPVGLQLLLPTVILALLPLLPESPRWLLRRGRYEDAVASMRRLRPGGVSDDEVRLEVEAIAFANKSEIRGTWGEVFDRTNRVRTGVAVLAMFGQQITGQAFPSQYGVVFYLSQGYGDKAFLFNVVSNIVSLAAVVFTWFYVDAIGRRPILLVGGSMMGAFLFLLGGMGVIGRENVNLAESRLVVASLMLFSLFYNLSWAPMSYIIVSEVAALKVKEKTNLLACVVSVLTAFATSFSCPYLINDRYANLGGKVGFIYGTLNFAMVVAVFYFIPELKGRTLEEVDQLFASGEALRKFSRVKTRTAEQLYVEELGRVQHEKGDERHGSVTA